MEAQLFAGQKPDETVTALVRPHWLILLRTVAAILFLSVIPIAVLAVVTANGVTPFSGIGLAVTVVAIPAYYLTLITWFFIAWVDYYLDVGIVTNHRIIDVDQRGMFRRSVAELDCRMVQDINADKTGVLETLFDFGNVIVQTAGERPNFVFHAVPHPDRMVDRIREVMNAAHSQEDGAAQKIQEAAEKVEEAVEKIEQPAKQAPPETPPAQSAKPAPTEESTSQDLPRQYER
jgi:hypothetical protein